MSSTFLGLTIGYSGLSAYQAALHTTGNNISNVRTEGYSRQQVSRIASESIRAYASYGTVGTGVTATSITQVRDVYYDYKYWDNSERYGEAYTKNYYMRQIEDYYEEENKPGISTALTALFTSMEELSKSAEDDTSRDDCVNSAESLAACIAELAVDWEKLQEDCNEEVKSKVDEINSIAQQLSVLNKQINMVEISGETANDLRDQRNLLIDQLSAIANVDVKENFLGSKQKDSYGNLVSAGVTSYTVKIDGQTLVNDYSYNRLDLVSRTEKLNQSDMEGLYDIVWSNGQDFNMKSTSLGGVLQGLIEMRDGNNAENLQATVGSVNLADNSVTVTNANITVESKMNMPDSGKITLNNKEYIYESFEYLGNGEYKFTMKDQLTQNDADWIQMKNQNGTSKKAVVGNIVEYCGIPYYMAKLNEFVRCFAQSVNEIHTKGKDLYGNQAGILYTGNKLVGGEYTFADTTVTSTSDTYYQLTARAFSVSDAIMNDVSLFSTTANVASGVAGTDILEKLQKLEGINIINDSTPATFLESILSDISVETQSSQNIMENRSDIAASIVNQRLSISGVDEDEEGIDLIKFQNAYNLCAKVISVMTEVYDRLILETGV